MIDITPIYPIEKEKLRIYKLELKDFLNELVDNMSRWVEEHDSDLDMMQLRTIYKNKLAAYGILI
jgi:hypothetical protein